MAGRGNTANLRPFQRGEARARDAGRAGGLRSAEARSVDRRLSAWVKQPCGAMTNGEAVVRRLYKAARHGSRLAARILYGDPGAPEVCG
jgi:hypothetical protein